MLFIYFLSSMYVLFTSKYLLKSYLTLGSPSHLTLDEKMKYLMVMIIEIIHQLVIYLMEKKNEIFVGKYIINKSRIGDIIDEENIILFGVSAAPITQPLEVHLHRNIYKQLNITCK